ncbi:MAG: DUF456 domain-containing protein [Acidaminococcaceae bacterium]
MEHWLGNGILYIVVIVCLFLTFLSMMGNVWLLGTAVAFAFYDNFMRFNEEFLLYLFLVFAAGELWEFFISLFGIKRKNVSWATVLVIGIGTIVGVIVGTAILPLFGSVVGGVAGSGIMAFTIEYNKNSNKADAWNLALLAMKTQLLAALGKITAGVVMASMMILQTLK